jgi:Family of unknown function (DUF6335)
MAKRARTGKATKQKAAKRAPKKALKKALKKAARKAAAKKATAKKAAPKKAAAKKAVRKAAKKPARKAAAKKARAKKAPARKAAAKARRPPVKKTAAKKAVPRKAAPAKAAAKKSARPKRAARPAPIRGAIPSSLKMGSSSSSARSGRAELVERIQDHNETGPAITAGDLDANWEVAYSSGDEAPGGDNPTPDQDIVDEIGHALGIEYNDDEELKGAVKLEERDRHRWELDPASAEDYPDHEN